MQQASKEEAAEVLAKLNQRQLSGVGVAQGGKVKVVFWSLGRHWRVTCEMVEVDGAMVVGALYVSPRPVIDAKLGIIPGKVPRGGIGSKELEALRITRARAWAGLQIRSSEAPRRKTATRQLQTGRPMTLPLSFYKRLLDRLQQVALEGHVDYNRRLLSDPEYRHFSHTGIRSAIRRAKMYKQRGMF